MFLRGAPIDIEFFEANDFWSKVAKGEGDACWLWLQSTASHGYGQTWDGVTVRLAHRVAWVLHHGEQIQDGMTVDHICRVRKCVNPAHLRLLTNVENARLNGNAIKTHCMAGHPFDEANTYTTTRGHRQCLACRAARKAG